MRRFNWVLFLDTGLLALCIFGAYRLALTAGFPVDVERQGEHLIVVRPGTVARSALQQGDWIHDLEGKQFTSRAELEFLCNSKAIGDLLNVTVQRGGKSLAMRVALPARYTLRYQVITSTAALAFFLMAVFVIYRRREDEAARALHHLGVITALLIQLTSGRFSIPPFGSGYILEILFQFAYVLMPIAFVRFALLFPSPRRRMLRRILPPLLLLASIISVWAVVAFLRASWPEFHLSYFDGYQTAFDALRIFFLIGILGAIAFMFSAYRNASEEFEQRKLLWIFFGVGFGVAGFVLLWLLPELLLGRGLISEEWTLAFSVVAPASFSIALVRYRLFDITVLLKRSTVYAIVIGAMLVLYLGVIGLLSVLAQPSALPTPIPEVLGALVIALLFEPLRRRVQRVVDRKFFRIEYNFHEMQRVAIEEIRFAATVSQLASLVVGLLNRVLPVSRLGFFIVEPGDMLRLAAHSGFELLERRGVRLQLGQLKSTLELPVGVPGNIEPGVAYEEADAEVFSRWGLSLVLPMLSADHHILGLLALSEKRSGTRFTQEDISLLNAMSAQSALALERIKISSTLLLEQEESDRLKELNRLKSYFVSSVSHDLKTPLSSIRIFAELLRNPELAVEKRNEYLTIVESETDRLARLISNVLDFATIERGSKTYNLQRCELNSIVSRVLQTMDYQCTSRGFAVSTTLLNRPLPVMADEDALHDAIINLLSNAMKYSPLDRKKIEIETKLDREWAMVAVVDHGFGIHESELERIFEPFYRVSNDAANAAGGAGLGLSLVRHVVGGHHGSVAVQSTIDHGSTFSFRIPLSEL